MCHERRPGLRAGFTLVELLLVIAILAILAAMTAAGVARVREAQLIKTTDETLTKLQLALDQQWKDVVDRCNQDRIKGKIPTVTVDFCDGDLDRAAALWAYINLKRELPETFAEGTNPIGLPGAPPPRSTFANLAAVGTTDDPSAVLLFLILSEKGTTDVSQLPQGREQLRQGDIGNHTVFKDAWGMPIRFRRFFQDAELNVPPFVQAASQNRFDAIDPRRKLWNWSNATNKAKAQSELGVTFTYDDTKPDSLIWNRLPTVISSGPNGPSERLNGATTLGFEMKPTGATDDSYGYRLRRLGKRGD